MGKTEIEVSRNHQASFESVILSKHKRDVSDIYGFKLSIKQISKITAYVLEEQLRWQNRTLASFIVSTGARKFWGFGFKIESKHI